MQYPAILRNDLAFCFVFQKTKQKQCDLMSFKGLHHLQETQGLWSATDRAGKSDSINKQFDILFCFGLHRIL